MKIKVTLDYCERKVRIIDTEDCVENLLRVSCLRNCAFHINEVDGILNLFIVGHSEITSHPEIEAPTCD